MQHIVALILTINDLRRRKKWYIQFSHNICIHEKVEIIQSPNLQHLFTLSVTLNTKFCSKRTTFDKVTVKIKNKIDSDRMLWIRGTRPYCMVLVHAVPLTGTRTKWLDFGAWRYSSQSRSMIFWKAYGLNISKFISAEVHIVSVFIQ